MALSFYCTKSFKKEYEKLLKKKSYSDFKDALITFIDIENKNSSDFFEGTKLNGNINTDPLLIKKRIQGSGGYRLYYYIYLVKNKIYFINTHPKTGKRGKTNLKDIKEIKNTFHTDLKNNDIYKLLIKENVISFEKIDKN